MTLNEIATELTPKVIITYNGRTIEAVRAGTQWNDIEKVNAGYGLSSSRDYIVRQTDFPAGERPQQNDRLVDQEGVWRVYPLDGEECWRYLGNESTGLIRIHTRRVNSAERNE